MRSRDLAVKKLLPLPVVAIIAGGLVAYTGWSDQPPPESTLAAVSGQVVGVERIMRTRWGRRHLIPREVYVGHDLAVRRQDGEVVTVRIPDWEGVPEDRIEALSQVNLRGRYDPRENVLYELVVEKNVLSTYYSSSEAQRENSRWNLLVGGAIAFAGIVIVGLLVSNRSKPDPKPDASQV
jgi:hypothetical protein